MKCKLCAGSCKKDGKQKSGNQKYRCKVCGRYQQKNYRQEIPNRSIIQLLKEGCGIRSISRLLRLSPATIIRKIRSIAKQLKRPTVYMGKEYEVDEMSTYVGNKNKRRWIAYVLRRDNGKVIDFVVGNRTLKTIERVTGFLLLSQPYKVYTDKLNIYQTLIPAEIHNTKQYGINKIERNNLTLRTHLKRLSRRTICFSKSSVMLIACLKIYFWA